MLVPAMAVASVETTADLKDNETRGARFMRFMGERLTGTMSKVTPNTHNGVP